MDDSVWVIDTEGDGLSPTKLHCLVATKDGKTFEKFTDYEDMRVFLRDKRYIACHNVVLFDIPVLERLLDLDLSHWFPIDTLALSWYLYPENTKHGLAEWGELFGVPKPEVEDWVGLSIEEYLYRCTEDVKINWRLWKKQERYLRELYGREDAYKKVIAYLAFKMKCVRLQAESRWKLDVKWTRNALEDLEEKKKLKRDELASVMPKVPIKRKKSKPAKPFKADGSLSKHGEGWMELLQEKKLPEDYEDDLEIIVGYSDPNPDSNPQVKDWLFSLGWEPDEFKYVKKDDGELKKIPQINKPFGAGLSESVKILFEKEPNLEHLDSYYVLSHRISILSGFLENVDEEGYVTARVSGLTNTLRFKHKEIVNLPKVNTPWGEQIRGALVAQKGTILCGSDMSSLEDRIKQHFMYKHDPDYVDQMNVPDFDPHLDLAIMAGMLSKEDVTQFKWYKDLEKEEAKNQSEDFIRSMVSIGKTRGIAKNGNYACQYGAGAPRLVLTTGITLAKATTLHEAYWKRNWAVKAVAKEQVVKTVQKQKWLWNPISKLWYSLRYEKDRFSTLVQGSAAYCFDLWLGLVLKERPQLTGQFHDEFILCIKEGAEDKCRELLNKAIKKTNDILQLDRELGIDIQFGKRYSEIH